MRDERGGAIWGFLGAIGLVVVLMAIFFAACFNSASGQPRSLAPAVVRHHDDGGGDRYGNGRNGPDNGNDGDQSRCRGDQCRGSFSPGPFDRSPIDIHDNCISPDCSGRDHPKQPPQDGHQPSDGGES